MWLRDAKKLVEKPDRDIPPLLLEYLTKQPPDDAAKYDAIILDEAQDFHEDWWKLLKLHLKDNGEMLLAADRAQNIYQREGIWTDGVMENAGFSGDWMQLSKSKRMPPELIDPSQKFARSFVPDHELPDDYGTQGDLPLRPYSFRWVNSGRKGSESCADVVRSAFDVLAKRADVESRTAIVLFNNEQIKWVSDALTASKCDHTKTYFRGNVDARYGFPGAIPSQSGDISQAAKSRLWRHGGGLMVTTVQTFKGLESTNIVIWIPKNLKPHEYPLVYVALTRVKNSNTGNHVRVVCDNLEINAVMASADLSNP